MGEAYTYILMCCVSSRDLESEKAEEGGCCSSTQRSFASLSSYARQCVWRICVVLGNSLPLPSFHPISPLFGFRVPAEMTRALFTRLLLLPPPTGTASRNARPPTLIESHSAHAIPLVRSLIPLHHHYHHHRNNKQRRLRDTTDGNIIIVLYRERASERATWRRGRGEEIIYVLL